MRLSLFLLSEWQLTVGCFLEVCECRWDVHRLNLQRHGRAHSGVHSGANNRHGGEEREKREERKAEAQHTLEAQMSVERGNGECTQLVVTDVCCSCWCCGGDADTEQ